MEEKQRAVRRMREQEAELAAQVPTFFLVVARFA